MGSHQYTISLHSMTLESNKGLQAFSAENLLCIFQLLILLTFRHQVIKKGI